MTTPRIITTPPGPKAKAILERDARVLSPSYARDYGFVMEHGKGAEVWDVDGNRYIDFCAGIAVNSTGHSHPEIVKAIQEQAEKYIHISSDYYHDVMVRVAERIDEIAPMEEAVTVFLTNSGTESVEAAIKLARYATGRRQFIGFLGGFHGRSMGSLSFTASKARQQERFFPTMPGVWHVPYPDPYRPIFPTPPNGDQGDAVVDYIENMLFPEALPPDEVAAILVEPIQGEGGYIIPPPNFFPRLRKLCDRQGILLIVDEVQAGMGRTGKWWAIQHYNIEPDIVCIAKGVASGVPMGAMAARSSIGAKWKPGAHGNTYGGNPLACVSALKTMELIENGMMQNAAEMGAYMLDAVSEMQARHASIGHVRGKGLMIGVELVLDRETKEPAREMRNAVMHSCFENGLLTLGCGRSTMRFMPPLMIGKNLVDEGLQIFEDALTQAEKR
ncbi:MAG: acetyl ornithine aminotransferase family protein [Chloroflexi bacterium]|nr:acetyl ornithine aminotransferase family protein [Chloroflexota bacterium]